jgi:hypothetical protein
MQLCGTAHCLKSHKGFADEISLQFLQSSNGGMLLDLTLKPIYVLSTRTLVFFFDMFSSVVIHPTEVCSYVRYV